MNRDNIVDMDVNKDFRRIANDIINVFEDLLDEHNIFLPDSFRSDEESNKEARIFGNTYYKLEDKIINILDGEEL